jgi:hypothetical protein
MTAERERIWRKTSEGLVLRLRLTPRSSKDAIKGVGDTAEGRAVLASVRAVPEDGAANEAAERLVAQWLGVAMRSVAVISGHKSRIKTVAIAGDGAELGRSLDLKIEAMAKSA